MRHTRPIVRVGRGDTNDASLESFGVSRQHGEIDTRGGPDGVVYRDLGSSNGSVVRRGAERFAVDESVGRSVSLRDGDELLLGPSEDLTVLSVRIVGAAPAAVRSSGAAGSASGLPDSIVQLASGSATVIGVNRIDDVAQISRRVEDDPEALRSLYALLKGVSGARDTRGLFDALSGLVLDAFAGATRITVYLRGAGDDGEFTPLLARERVGGAVATAPSRTLLGRLLENREAILFQDLASVGNAASLVGADVQSGLVVPLWDVEEVRGFVQVESRIAANAFSEKDLDLATLMGNQAALILRNISMTESLRELNAELTAALERIETLNRAKEHLAKFVPATVRRTVESRPLDPELQPRDMDASVLFLDIGGYTKLTEALDREQVSFLVERYFSAFIDDIYENDGDINETAGDGLMIIFQSDDPAQHCVNAVRAAVAVRRKTHAVNEELGRVDDPIAVNMGINTGTVSIGSRKIAGITGERWTYTATGMVTNVSARIGAHATNGKIFIGPATAERVRGSFSLDEHEPVAFKNVSQPMAVFEVLD